jgi:hypothetical protein
VAACVTLLLLTRQSHRGRNLADLAIDSAMTRSSQLEELIQWYNPEQRVTDGRTARAVGQLEARIAQVDEQLEVAQLAAGRPRGEEVLQLWRERVGLLDALVDVHLTRASQIGF